MSIEDLVGAVRAADGDDPELAAVTRLRVRRSLEGRARGRHRLVGLLTTLGILSGGTASWALATGQITALWSPERELPALQRVTEGAEAPRPRRASAGVAAARPRLVPEPVLPAVVADEPSREPSARASVVATETPVVPEVSAVPEVAQPAVRRAPSVPRAAVERPASSPPLPDAPPAGPVEALYRRAHELHFHGGSPAAALAAWDAYLVAEPSGRFSAEARYNRALVLVRLARYAEARAALAPFARGEIEAGYRQAEAGQLVERLVQYP